MRSIKKLFSIVMVLTLVLALGAQAFAAEENPSIKIKGPHDVGSVYSAYQLLTATYVRTDPIGDVYDYHINAAYKDAIKAGLDAVYTGDDAIDIDDEPAVIDAISRLGSEVQAFANAVFAKIGTATPEHTAEVTAENASGDIVIENVPGGYYLISEKVSDATAGTATSLVMLDTAGHPQAEVTVKEDHPSSEKKVWEKNDTTSDEPGWQDGADWDIGDNVPYQLAATIADKHYADYDTYYLQFVDDMSKGLGEPENTKIYWLDSEGEHVITGSFNGPTQDTSAESKYTDGKVYTWTCDDIKKAGVPAGATIYVEYTSELLEDTAVIGPNGNPNEMHIEYSNNPYGDGHGHTPDDKVTVFTFNIEAKKVDGTGEELKGAGFTLFKLISKLPDGETAKGMKDADGNPTKWEVGDYYQVDSKTYQVVEEEITGVTTFTFKGQDSGTYLLAETTVPAGYNKADDIEITVEATYETNAIDPKLTGLTVTPEKAGFTAALDTGVISGTVINLTGLELPSTGGIGTTIFYVVGAVLVAGAVILLVTKRRVNGANK